MADGDPGSPMVASSLRALPQALLELVARALAGDRAARLSARLSCRPLCEAVNSTVRRLEVPIAVSVLHSSEEEHAEAGAAAGALVAAAALRFPHLQRLALCPASLLPVPVPPAAVAAAARAVHLGSRLSRLQVLELHDCWLDPEAAAALADSLGAAAGPLPVGPRHATGAPTAPSGPVAAGAAAGDAPAPGGPGPGQGVLLRYRLHRALEAVPMARGGYMAAAGAITLSLTRLTASLRTLAALADGTHARMRLALVVEGEVGVEPGRLALTGSWGPEALSRLEELQCCTLGPDDLRAVPGMARLARLAFGSVCPQRGPTPATSNPDTVQLPASLRRLRCGVVQPSALLMLAQPWPERLEEVDIGRLVATPAEAEPPAQGPEQQAALGALSQQLAWLQGHNAPGQDEGEEEQQGGAGAQMARAASALQLAACAAHLAALPPGCKLRVGSLHAGSEGGPCVALGPLQVVALKCLGPRLDCLCLEGFCVSGQVLRLLPSVFPGLAELMLRRCWLEEPLSLAALAALRALRTLRLERLTTLADQGQGLAQGVAALQEQSPGLRLDVLGW